MSTALVLINRVRAKAREEQIAAFASGDELTTALLSELNQAIRIVLEERTWNFQVRSDGDLVTRAIYEEATGTAISLGANITFTFTGGLPDTSDLNGSFRTSFIATGDSVVPNTTFDLKVCRLGSATTVVGELNAVPPYAIISAGWKLYSYQYALPATARAVTDVWYQEENLEIFQESEHDFRQLVPRPHEDLGSNPRVAFIGGTIVTTTGTSGTTGTEQNVIRVWPVPTNRTRINYRYIYRNADLVNATDSLVGVPLSVEDLIVQLAYSRQLQSIQSDPTRGLEMEQRVMAEVDRKHRNNRFDPHRHRRLKSLDEIGSRRSQLTRTHTTVPGWP